MKPNKITNITLSGVFLALGLVLPLLTGQIPYLGNMLLPMHLPVFLCALICGWPYGLAVGLVLPLLRSVLFGMPVLFPVGLAMTFELAAYGLIAGWLYARSRWKCVLALYRAMLTAMLGGRLVWGLVMVILAGLGSAEFSWQIFLSGALLNAIPGIIIQLTLIPLIMVALNRTGLVPFHKAKPAKARKES